MNFHESVWLAGVIDVVGTIATAAAIEAPAFVDPADAKSTAPRPASGFCICDFLARVLRDFMPAFEVRN